MPSNCYGYALRIDLNPVPGTRKGKSSALENWSDGFGSYPFIDRQKEVLIAACISDGLRTTDSGKKQIAVFVHKYKSCIDYHFYRLDDNNTWSCQDSTGGPITTGISNPVEYDKGLVGKKLHTGTLKGQMYAGLLYLPSGDNMQSGWDD